MAKVLEPLWDPAWTSPQLPEDPPWEAELRNKTTLGLAAGGQHPGQRARRGGLSPKDAGGGRAGRRCLPAGSRCCDTVGMASAATQRGGERPSSQQCLQHTVLKS